MFYDRQSGSSGPTCSVLLYDWNWYRGKVPVSDLNKVLAAGAALGKMLCGKGRTGENHLEAWVLNLLFLELNLHQEKAFPWGEQPEKYRFSVFQKCGNWENLRTKFMEASPPGNRNLSKQADIRTTDISFTKMLRIEDDSGTGWNCPILFQQQTSENHIVHPLGWVHTTSAHSRWAMYSGSRFSP